ncbi:hypothetical protein NDU88_000642 [Pleurodeles waltl]|uniref:Uncharacterized protein n=1 Tax=Pleurodeles waltl TaxID=8319 RepID=A0AAV7V9J1_PLEWA|nr:hypothetical protein NDU88_000642 [Pleurodeles waltl]
MLVPVRADLAVGIAVQWAESAPHVAVSPEPPGSLQQLTPSPTSAVRPEESPPPNQPQLQKRAIGVGARTPTEAPVHHKGRGAQCATKTLQDHKHQIHTKTRIQELPSTLDRIDDMDDDNTEGTVHVIHALQPEDGRGRFKSSVWGLSRRHEQQIQQFRPTAASQAGYCVRNTRKQYLGNAGRHDPRNEIRSAALQVSVPEVGVGDLRALEVNSGLMAKSGVLAWMASGLHCEAG